MVGQRLRGEAEEINTHRALTLPCTEPSLPATVSFNPPEDPKERDVVIIPVEVPLNG